LGLLRRRLQARVGPVRLGGGHLLPVVAAGAVAGGVGVVGRSLVTGLAPPLALVIAGLPTALAYLATTATLRVEEPAALLAAVRRRLH
ncbi:MAG: hypothetical protein M3N11_05975, partial [Actinomycetota bacterium]|nr:hypothetical protein [Actinomycetota bacterium]